MEFPDWKQLSTADRIRRCHAMASEARNLARTAKGADRRRYLAIADEWDVLASAMAAASGWRSARSLSRV